MAAKHRRRSKTHALDISTAGVRGDDVVLRENNVFWHPWTPRSIASRRQVSEQEVLSVIELDVSIPIPEHEMNRYMTCAQACHEFKKIAWYWESETQITGKCLSTAAAKHTIESLHDYIFDCVKLMELKIFHLCGKRKDLTVATSEEEDTEDGVQEGVIIIKRFVELIFNECTAVAEKILGHGRIITPEEHRAVINNGRMGQLFHDWLVESSPNVLLVCAARTLSRVKMISELSWHPSYKWLVWRIWGMTLNAIVIPGESEVKHTFMLRRDPKIHFITYMTFAQADDQVTALTDMWLDPDGLTEYALRDDEYGLEDMADAKQMAKKTRRLALNITHMRVNAIEMRLSHMAGTWVNLNPRQDTPGFQHELREAMTDMDAIRKNAFIEGVTVIKWYTDKFFSVCDEIHRKILLRKGLVPKTIIREEAERLLIDVLSSDWHATTLI